MPIAFSRPGKRGGRENRPLFRAGCFVLLTTAFLVLWIGAVAVMNWLRPSVIIGLSYGEASQGLNPNKTRFSTSQFLQQDILEEVKRRGNLERISVEELRDALEVTPLTPEKTVSYKHPYIATEYKLICRGHKLLGKADPRKVTALTAQVFQEKYGEYYVRKRDVLKLNFQELRDVDYLDAGYILGTRADNIQDYALMCQAESYAFLSENTGETFASIARKAGNLKDRSLESFEAFVLKNGISRDKAGYIGKLNYENEMLDIDYRKSLAGNQVMLEAIDLYERDMARIVLIPTLDDDGEFYMSRTKLGVDYFADEAKKSMERAAQLSLKMETNGHFIDSLAQNKSSQTAAIKADAMAEAIKGQLDQLAGTLVETVEELDAKQARQYVVVSAPPAAFFQAYAIKKGILFSALSAFALLAFLKMASAGMVLAGIAPAGKGTSRDDMGEGGRKNGKKGGGRREGA